jgi:deoxyribonuclease-4
VHAGRAVGTHGDAARGPAAGSILTLLDAQPGIRIAVELTAGGGERSLARTVPDVAELLAYCGDDERVGVCIDSCHLWAAGADWTTPAGRRRLRREVDALGRERILVVHANDSHDPLASARDHHANIGDGTIGAAPFRAFVRAPEWRHAPIVIETGGDDDRRAADVALIRSML